MTDGANHQAELMGPAEIATLLGVKRSTVEQMKWRGDLPPADYRLSGRDLWLAETILEWARVSGRTKKLEAARKPLSDPTEGFRSRPATPLPASVLDEKNG